MTTMVMSNPLIMNEQNTNFNPMSEQRQEFMVENKHQQQEQQQLMHQHISQYQQKPLALSSHNQQHQEQQQARHHHTCISNQLNPQKKIQYSNDADDQSARNTQHQQHMNRLQHIEYHNLHNEYNIHDANQQEIISCYHRYGDDNLVHNVQDETTADSSIQPHHFHQHSMALQQNQHTMQMESHNQFQLQLQHQDQQYTNAPMIQHVDVVPSSDTMMTDTNSKSEMRHSQTSSLNEEDINLKQMSQQQLMHNYGMQRFHVQNENFQNINHDTMQQTYVRQPGQFQNCEAVKQSTMEIKGHCQHMLISHPEASPTSDNIIEVQGVMRTNASPEPSGDHYQQQAQLWQNRRSEDCHQSPPVTHQNFTCNSIDRVPPIYHHIPQSPTWVDGTVRKKAKPGKSLTKKQRSHITEIRSNSIEQPSKTSEEHFNKFQSNPRIRSTVRNSPSFLDDPSGYLAQQTALLNSTISRQTGGSSSQMVDNAEAPQNSHLVNHANYLPLRKPSTPGCTSAGKSVKNHATSPVITSSMTSTFIESNLNDTDIRSSQECTMNSNGQDMQGQCKQDMYSQYRTHLEQDSRPIQGGTITTSNTSPIGTNSPTNLDKPPSSVSGTSQPMIPQHLMASQSSASHSHCQTSASHSNQVPPQSFIPVVQQSVQSSTNPTQVHHVTMRSPSSTVSPSTSPQMSLGKPSPIVKKSTSRHLIPDMSLNPCSDSTVITTIVNGHTFSSNTITSVFAGNTNTETVSINMPSTTAKSVIASSLPCKLPNQSITWIDIPTSPTVHSTNSSTISHCPLASTIISKSPLDMVQSVVSSIQLPQANSNAMIQNHQIKQHHHQQQRSQQQQQTPEQQSSMHFHNLLTSSGMLKPSAESTLAPGHILVSSGGQLLVASTSTRLNGVMAPLPPKIISNGSSLPPLSVPPMITSGTVGQVIPAVGVAQQVIGQPNVFVNTIQTPVRIQSRVMTMEGIRHTQLPHLTVTTDNAQQNVQSIIDTNQNTTKMATSNILMNKHSTLVSPESGISKKKICKRRKNKAQTPAPMLYIPSGQHDPGLLMQSPSNFAQQSVEAPTIGNPMLQALTLVPGKCGMPAQLVMNGQGVATSQFNISQIITNPQPTQQINLLQSVNLLNGATGIVQNFPTTQQYIVSGLGSVVMSADGTTALQDPGNMGMQLQIRNVNGQNMLTPVQSHPIFSSNQSILTAGPVGMVIRAPQTIGAKVRQHSAMAPFLSPNGGQFVVNGPATFGNPLSPIVANIRPSEPAILNTSQVSPTNVQAQQECIHMNSQTLMVPCATAHGQNLQNLAVSTTSNQQNTTFVQQNTTIVQQQTTLVSNNQIPEFQTVVNSNTNADHSLSIDHNESYIMKANLIHGKSPTSPKTIISSPLLEENIDDQQQQFVLSSTSADRNIGKARHSRKVRTFTFRHSVSTQTADNEVNVRKYALISQGSSPDTTTHSPGNSRRSHSPAVDTTSHEAASPAPASSVRHHLSLTPMVHCISSSEPHSAAADHDIQATDDWQIQSINDELTLNQLGWKGKAYDEPTVTIGSQPCDTSAVIHMQVQ